MYLVSKEASFAAAHLLRNYNGKCENLHGHNWKIQVTAEGKEPGEGGMLIDFTLLKSSMMEVFDKLDHKFLNEVPPFDKIEPSSENLAKYICDEMGKLVDTDEVKISQVKVWETDTSCATYIRED